MPVPAGGQREARCGVLVIGGGVCGLWTLHALLVAGYDAWLIERSALGDGQTIASQGILHRGTKYLLPGASKTASKEAAGAVPVWEAAMRGERGPDLRGVRVLSDSTVFWTMPTAAAKGMGKAARFATNSAMSRVPREEWAGGFAGAPDGIDVYRAAEPVLDPASVVSCLASGVAGRARRGTVTAMEARVDGVSVLIDEGDDGAVRVEAGGVVFAAGAGNEGLTGMVGGRSGVMQRRPLHQLVARGAPFDLYGHCIGASTEPLVTITTGVLDGERTWYFGGGPAEDGIGRDADEQEDAGRRAVAKFLPWVDAGGLRWSTFRIDRAEGENRGKRPPGPTATWVAERAVAVWPTKLVLAPRAAEMVLERLRARGVTPGDGAERSVLASLPDAPVAERVW